MDQFGVRPTHDNHYRLEPREHERFYPSKVQKVVEEVVQMHLQDKEYDHTSAKGWAEEIVSQIKTQVKALKYDSYKIVVQAVIGEVKGQGVRVASKCLWDVSNDNYASYTYQNESLFCTGIVFGIYFE